MPLALLLAPLPRIPKAIYSSGSIVELSVKLKSVLTQCACKRLRINLEFFSEPSKKKRKK